jgi:hypothetical protein
VACGGLVQSRSRHLAESSPYRINDPWLSCRSEANPLIEQGFEPASEIGPVKRPSVEESLSILVMFRKRPRNVRAVSEANRQPQVLVSFDLRVRFRYSRLKEAALFAADAMGFQSTLAWKLLEDKRLRHDTQIEVDRYKHGAKALMIASS